MGRFRAPFWRWEPVRCMGVGVGRHGQPQRGSFLVVLLTNAVSLPSLATGQESEASLLLSLFFKSSEFHIRDNFCVCKKAHV